MALFFPETHRRLVGNGSGRASGLLYRTLFSSVTSHRRGITEQSPEPTERRVCHFPNPFACLPMLASKGTFSVIMFGSITYAIRMTLQASLATHCIAIYDLNYLQAGLIYLPAGVSGTVGAKLGGVLIDRTYRSVCKRVGEPVNRGQHRASFPIEQARLRGAYLMLLLSSFGALGYGLALMTKAVSCSTPSISTAACLAR